MPTPLIEQLLKGNTERKSGEGKSPLVDYLLNPENQRNAASQPQPEPAQEPGLFSLAAKGTARGLIETFPKFAGTATEYLGTRLGVPAMQEAGKVSREFWGKQAEKFNPPESLQGNIWDNPKLMARASWWAYNLPETAVSMASSLIPGGAAYKFLRSAGALQRAALVGASIAGGAAGGALEGANTFEELQKKGASPQEAALGAELMSAASAGLNAISTGKIFGKGLSSRIVKFITDGTTEGLTEWLEEPSEGLIKMGLGYATPAEVWNQMKEGVNVIPLSFVTGGVAGAVTGDRGTAEKPAVDNTQKRIDAVTGNMSSDDIFDLWQEEEDLDAKQELAKALEEAQKREASGVRPSPINVRKEEPLPVTQTEPVTAEEQPEETEEPEIVSLQKMAEELGIDVTGMDADGAKEAIDDFMAFAEEKTNAEEIGTETQSGSEEEGIDGGEGGRIRLRDDAEGGMETGAGETIAPKETIAQNTGNDLDVVRGLFQKKARINPDNLMDQTGWDYARSVSALKKLQQNGEVDFIGLSGYYARKEALAKPIEEKPIQEEITPQESVTNALEPIQEPAPTEPSAQEPVQEEKKEPWQMTRSEYGDVVSKLRAPEAAEMWVKDGIVNKGDDFYRYNIHKLYVKKALSEGKPVPAEVLAEYPDLAEKYGKISKPSEEPTPAEPATKPTVKENLTVAQEPVPVLRGTNVQEKKPESKPINVANGRKGKTYLTDNTEVKFDYAIVELDDLIASHDTDFRVNPEFPSELQPRDRDRFANKVQVEEMSQSINPERLAESSSASTGAPIISEDGVVLSGNGRTIALKKSYQTEKENGYKKWISENSQRFGVNDISGFKNPVLVRIVKSGIDREQFVKSANKTETIGMSATEQAAQDAQIIDDELIDLFNPSADGDLTATSNRMFMNAFLRKLDIGEQAGLLTKEGNYTKALIDRVKAALFEKAYNDKELLSMLAEETDININNIINALVVSSNRYIRAAKVDKSGEIKPLTECVVAAVHVIRKARNEGTPIQEMFRQETFFDEIPIEVKKIASMLDADKRSAKRIGYFLSNIADTFSRKKKSDLNEKFFDDPIDFSPISIIDEAIENRREQYGKEGNQGVFDFTGRVGESGKSKGYGGTAPTKSVPGSKESTEEPRFAISPRSKSSTGSTVTSSVQHKDVVEWVARLQKRFSIPIVPVRNINGLPSYYVEAAIRASKERGIVMGLYDPYTEAVWIVSDGVRSKEEFYRTILHETVGHAGIRRIAGKDYENFLLTIANSKKYQDDIYTYAAKNQYDIITATDEWFAEQVETGKIDRSLWSRFVAAIRRAIRSLGINMEFSEQDLKELVRRSYEATTTGTAEGGTALMGQPMFATRKEQTETPEFKRWFGDSKVVDEDGKPLVVYHGTSNPVFTKFSKNYRGGLGGKLGFWFASTGKAASQFARERFAGQGAGIYPVYLAINNPIEYKGWKEFHSHVEKLRGNKDIEFGTKSLLQQAKKRGFDGIVIRNSDTDMGGMRDDWVAFEPTQIKSAIGNRGTFDPNNPDIRFATQKNQQNINPANILSVPPETWWGLTERTFFDKYNRMVQVQQAYLDNKQPGQSPFNVIDRIRLFMGRTGDQIDRLDKRVVAGKDSLLRRMTEDGIGLDEMDLYLYASHAKERNEHVQNINAKFSESEGGSGMTNDEADIALKELTRRNKPFEKYAKEIRALAKEAMELRFQAGLIDKNTRDRIVSKFKNYVPLKGNSEKSKFSMMLGRGFSVTRKEFHRLFGRESKAESPFAQILIDYQEAVIRSENNAVGNELLNLIQEAGEDNILLANGRPMFTIEKQKFIPRYDKDGELLYFDPKFQLADNVMAVKRNEMVWEIADGATGMKRYQENQPKKLGNNQTAQQVEKNFTYYITINDRAMAEGMKNLGQTKTIPFIHAINNYLRMVNTVISPSFIFTNMQRDLETAGLYMLGDENASFMIGVMKDVPNAMRGIWRDTREKTPNQWSDLYDRLKKLGGKVGFFDLQTNEQKLERLKKNVKALSKENPLRQARGALIAARDLIMDANESVEGGVRLAYFKHLLDKGVAEEKAAIAAKQLTIDFNQRGNWATILNTLYLFANANLQGGYRFAKWAIKSKRNGAIVLSVAMAAMMLAMRNRWVGGDDYDRMTDNDKDNHLLFMLPGGKSLAIKVAYGFNVPVAIGNILEEAYAGKMSIGGAMSRLMVAMDRAFNPMSGGSWLQAVSPTFLDLVVQLAENRNAFGSPIYKEQPAYSASVPDSQLYFKGVNPWLRETALGLNRVTGGTDKISGWMDISPETVEHIAETASGGLGKFVMNTINTGLALSSSEEETEINKIPIVREFVKEPSRWVSASKAREMLKESGRTLYSVDETREYNHLLNEAIKDKSIKPETARRMRTEFRNNQTDARKSLRKAGK